MKKFACCLLALFVLTGCASSTVRHLPRQQWKTGIPQQLAMRYLTFQYQVTDRGEEVVVNAEVFPEVGRLPDWASWYGEIVISIYVADEDGKVLSCVDHVLAPRPLNREGALPVEAVFDLGTARHQPLSVSFGYRVQLMDAETDPAHKTLVAEQALKVD